MMPCGILDDAVGAGCRIICDRTERHAVLLEQDNARPAGHERKARRGAGQLDREGKRPVAAKLKGRKGADRIYAVGTVANAAGQTARKRVIVEQDLEVG